ncbi:hypothetical protein R3P38DRAFT_3246405 [Favolaschia claudopus]|uniref:Uncharacterized protein n=1 Tax=Favolaschia claudopus TaxID=2862362 RepID=A0AAV9YYV6_9AGAR
MALHSHRRHRSRGGRLSIGGRHESPQRNSLFPFSTSKPSSSCYMRVALNSDDTGVVPRFDLLEIWMAALQAAKPEGEVVWQPMSEGIVSW